MKRTILLMVMLLAACTAQQPDIPAAAPPAPVPPPPAPVVEVTPQVEANVVDADAGVHTLLPEARTAGNTVITIDDIDCDLLERTLTFRFRNVDTRNWNLDRNLPIVHDDDIVEIDVTLNQYRINGHEVYRSPDGDIYFGPEERFSDNCGGVQELASGEETVCTLTPVPLRNKYYLDGSNELFINPPGTNNDAKIKFTCA